MDFSDALKHIKNGKLMKRAHWNNQFAFIVPGSTFAVSRPPLLGIFEKDTIINYHSHIDMRMPNGQIVPDALTMADILADDWSIVSTQEQTHEQVNVTSEEISKAIATYLLTHNLVALTIDYNFNEKLNGATVTVLK